MKKATGKSLPDYAEMDYGLKEELYQFVCDHSKVLYEEQYHRITELTKEK
jgi:hypothetical protein